MSEDNQERISIRVTQQDFGVIRASLQQAISFWEHMVATGQYPENFNEDGAREIVKMNQEVLEKVEMILAMNPLPSHNVGVCTDGC